LTNETLEPKLFSPSICVELGAKALPDFDYIYRELKAHRKFIPTLDLLWEEYKEQYPQGYQYSQFCGLSPPSERARLLHASDHKGGEKLFADYGEGLSLIDPQTLEPINDPP
jgi:hypothetical protein